MAIEHLPFPTRTRPAIGLALLALAAGSCRLPGPEPDTQESFLEQVAAGGHPVENLAATEEGVSELEAFGLETFDDDLAELAALEGWSDDQIATLDEPPLNPYLEFGSRIIVHENGLITKPFTLPLGKAQRILTFMSFYAPFPVQVVDPANPLETAAGPDHVLAEVIKDWDTEYHLDLRTLQASAAAEVVLADWLVITTSPELLYEVEAFMDLFLASIPQIEIEAKIVEVTESKQLDIGVSTSIKDADGSDLPAVAFPGHTLLDSFNPDFPNSGSTGEGSFVLGAVQDGVTYNLLIQAAEHLDNVDITSMPSIAVRENSRAEILNTQELPSYTISGINQSGNFSAQLTYKEIGIKLYAVPRVLGTDTVALYVDIEASQQVGEQSFFISTGDTATSELSAPVIASRSAKTIVHLKPGQGVILGGLTTERTVTSKRRVPVLGSIPILGFLFRSSFDRVERTTVLFFIRPRILEGSEFQREF